ILRKQIKRPAHGIAGSFMPGCNKGKHLVMNLLIGHGVSLVLRLKQHRKNIAYISSIRTALLNQVVYEGIQLALARHHPTIACKRKIETEPSDRAKVPDRIGNHSCNCPPQAGTLSWGIEVEQGFQDNTQ